MGTNACCDPVSLILACAVTYKQSIQCWGAITGRAVQQYTKFPTKFPAAKFPALQVTGSRKSKTGCSTTPHNSTERFDPNRRPYTTERLLFTPNTGCRFAVLIRRTVHSSLKATKDNPSRGPVHVSLFFTRCTQHNQGSNSCSKCEMQSRRDALTPVTKLQ